MGKSQRFARMKEGHPFLFGVWQLFLLFVIGSVSIMNFHIGLILGAEINGMSASLATFLLIAYAAFAEFLALLVWENLMPKVDCTFVWLSGFVFFVYIILGLAAFGFFLYYSTVFWCGDFFSTRFVAPMFGILFFIAFIHKTLTD